MSRILLVEDNALSRDMLSRRLAKKGYDVVIAEDGAQAVSQALAERPDLVLMDLALPVLDGWEATRRIKAEPRTAAIPVIGLSAHAMTEDAQRAREAGCDDFDTKPVDFARLLEKIERLVGAPPAGGEVSIAARAENLAAIRAFVQDACRRAGAEPRAAFDLKLAVDEACANIIEHGYAGRTDGMIAIAWESDGEKIRFALADRGRGFSPDALPPADTTSGWEQRPIGGLGWHLIRQSVDDVDYRPDPDGGNRLVLVKRLRSAAQ